MPFLSTSIFFQAAAAHSIVVFSLPCSACGLRESIANTMCSLSGPPNLINHDKPRPVPRIRPNMGINRSTDMAPSNFGVWVWGMWGTKRKNMCSQNYSTLLYTALITQTFLSWFLPNPGIKICFFYIGLPATGT